MHEVSVCESLLQLLEKEARQRSFRQVRRLRLAIGQFACIDPDALRFAFEAVGRGSIAEGAALEIDRPPGLAWCEDCSAQVELASRLHACPRCGGLRLVPRGGDEMLLVELEVA